MSNPAAAALLAFVSRKRSGGVIINEHTLSSAQTAFHVRVLGRWFDFIRLEELGTRIRCPGKRPFCVLTFDDGKRGNFTQVAPELERLRVPATFYVTTGPITTGSPFWFDQRDELVNALGHCPAGLESKTLKSLRFDQLMKRLNQACADYELNLPSEVFPMSWEQVRSLARRGFSIGAHGVTHAVLTCERRSDAFAEIEESIATVAAEIRSGCAGFAFPNGSYDGELVEHAVRCGARSIMTTDPMWVDSASCVWQLPRIQLFGNSSQARIELKVALAAFRGLLRNPNGSGRRYPSAEIHAPSLYRLRRMVELN